MASTIKVNNIQNQCGANIANKCGTTITLGASGDTITLACGASQTGFGRTGTVDWDTTAKTASFTAVSGNGYFVNTTSGALTVTLPASPSAGDIVSIADYAGTSATNNITIARNGSNIEGVTEDATIYENRDAITLVYVDGTQGWVPVNNNEKSGILPPAYVTATGGTITCCGDYKIHTFTGPGTFCVSCGGNAGGSNSVEYLVVAGGGGGATWYGGSGAGAGAGAGGFRLASPSLAPVTYPAKPLAAPANLPVTAQGYPITVGAGGAGQITTTGGVNGSVSTFSTIQSAGGGAALNCSPSSSGNPGGSGGGQSGTGSPGTAGSGNTPPVSPPQGNPGGSIPDPGSGAPKYATGGGGGAIAAGQDRNPHNQPVGGAGGDGGGIPTAFGSNGVPCGSFRYYAGGGGGSVYDSPGVSGGAGGKGGGGAGAIGANATAGTANTGGGGGGMGGGAPAAYSGGSGGSGIVIIRYKYQ
jgi:hypothetical protein